MFEPAQEVVGVPPGYESRRVVRLSEEDQDPVRVSQCSVVVVTACNVSVYLLRDWIRLLTQPGLGSQGQHVGVVLDDGGGAAQILHGGPVLLDLGERYFQY